MGMPVIPPSACVYIYVYSTFNSCLRLSLQFMNETLAVFILPNCFMCITVLCGEVRRRLFLTRKNKIKKNETAASGESGYLIII